MKNWTGVSVRSDHQFPQPRPRSEKPKIKTDLDDDNQTDLNLSNDITNFRQLTLRLEKVENQFRQKVENVYLTSKVGSHETCIKGDEEQATKQIFNEFLEFRTLGILQK